MPAVRVVLRLVAAVRVLGLVVVTMPAMMADMMSIMMRVMSKVTTVTRMMDVATSLKTHGAAVCAPAPFVLVVDGLVRPDQGLLVAGAVVVPEIVVVLVSG